MNTLDIIFIVVLGIGFIVGWYKGIITQLSLGAGIIIGLLQAILFYQAAGTTIQRFTEWNPTLCNIIGFMLIFIVVMAIFKLIGMVLKWLFSLVLLGFADRALGGLFTGFITTLLFIGAVSTINMIDEENALFGKTSQENSMLYKPMRKLSITFLEEVKKEVHEKKE